MSIPKSAKRFKPGSSFRQAMMLYRFDKKLITKLHNLFAIFPEIDLAAMGFPKGWEKEPIWT